MALTHADVETCLKPVRNPRNLYEIDAQKYVESEQPDAVRTL